MAAETKKQEDPVYSDAALRGLQKKFPAALDYLVSIFILNREYGEATNGRLAGALGVSKPAVSQAVRRLKKQGLAEQDLYGAVRFTPEGRIIAVRVIKRHYLIEHLLIRKLGYPWEKSDEEAQRIQGVISEEFAEFLDEAFGHPDTCPHGNPFPGSPREAELVNAPRLSDAPSGRTVTLVRITEEGETREGLLPFCYRQGLKPGTALVFRGPGRGDSLRFDLPGQGNTALEMPLPYARYLCYLP